MRKEPLDRAMARIVKHGECWLWQGQKNRNGYGRFTVNKKRVMVHIWMYINCKGKYRKGAILLHSCDTPACCNPDHLTPGTFAENTADMVAKGRHRSPFKNGN